MAAWLPGLQNWTRSARPGDRRPEEYMSLRTVVTRRTLLRASVVTSAGVAIGSARPAPGSAAAPVAEPTIAAPPFVRDYRTNIMANLTTDTNAAVRILSGMQ